MAGLDCLLTDKKGGRYWGKTGGNCLREMLETMKQFVNGVRRSEKQLALTGSNADTLLVKGVTLVFK